MIEVQKQLHEKTLWRYTRILGKKKKRKRKRKVGGELWGAQVTQAEAFTKNIIGEKVKITSTRG